eukprot:4017356-Pleurochrysis_carterae.AAC.1
MGALAALALPHSQRPTTRRRALSALVPCQDLPVADAVNGYGAEHAHVGARPMRAPKWLQRPCGATFGFGGKIAYFSSASAGVVSVADVPTDTHSVNR